MSEERKPGAQYYRWLATRRIEEELEEAQPAADWIMRHPPGAKLPDHLEPGYEPDPYEPTHEDCTKVPCDHWESIESTYFYGHCSHGSCPNYREICPVHEGGAH
jgi:hypothetical protein